MNAAPMGTQSFVCFTAANPARVWAVLTGTHETGSYVYGLVTHSSWEADAPIHFRTAQSPTAVYSSLTGRVLHVRPLCRLSYLVQSGPEDPPVYLTWQIRPCRGGSTIRLQVDEIGYADNDEEAENTWLPVLAALQALLARDEPALPEPIRMSVTAVRVMLARLTHVAGTWTHRMTGRPGNSSAPESAGIGVHRHARGNTVEGTPSLRREPYCQSEIRDAGPPARTTQSVTPSWGRPRREATRQAQSAHDRPSGRVGPGNRTGLRGAAFGQPWQSRHSHQTSCQPSCAVLRLLIDGTDSAGLRNRVPRTPSACVRHRVRDPRTTD